jgi:hypothetical protein
MTYVDVVRVKNLQGSLKTHVTHARDWWETFEKMFAPVDVANDSCIRDRTLKLVASIHRTKGSRGASSPNLGI